MSNVWCKYCKEYPVRRRQPGSNLCIEGQGRSIDARPCQPRLTLAGHIRKSLHMPIGSGR